MRHAVQLDDELVPYPEQVQQRYAGWLARLPDLARLAGRQTELVQVEQQLASIDWGDLEARQNEIDRLSAEARQIKHTREQLIAKQAVLKERLQTIQAQSPALRQIWESAQAQVAECESEADASALADLRARYDQVRAQYAPERVIEVYENQRRGDETQLARNQDELQKQQLDFQNQYNFRPPPNQADQTAAFLSELARLEATELPGYKSEIERAAQDAEVEFREHFIHRLREKIQEARYRLDQLNDSLKHVIFSGTRYHFIHEPNPEYRAFYELIVNEAGQVLGLPLLQGIFYQDHKDVIDELFKILSLQTPGIAQAEVERLCDYRSYLTYDIELRQDDGRKERFSKVGKTQAPYYVAMVAAFADLYRVMDERRNDTARLIVFDEAFNRMDRENTQSALELMQRYQLQVITATPPKRYDEIAPFMQTSILLNRIGSQVIPHSYQRERIDGR